MSGNIVTLTAVVWSFVICWVLTRADIQEVVVDSFSVLKGFRIFNKTLISIGDFQKILERH